MGFSLTPIASPALAGEADVAGAKARQAADGSWTFDATILHTDEGWDHYSDRFEIVAPDGEVVGTRTLLHPHIDEQPFTRSIGGVVIPDEFNEVTVRAHDSVHAFGGAEFVLVLPR